MPTAEAPRQTPPAAFYPPNLKAGKAAAYLGISRRYLTELAAAGRLPYHKLGRRCVVYRRADLDSFLAAHRVEG